MIRVDDFNVGIVESDPGNYARMVDVGYVVTARSDIAQMVLDGEELVGALLFAQLGSLVGRDEFLKDKL